MPNGTAVVLPCELRPSPEHSIEILIGRIGRTVALAATVTARGIEEWRAGGIQPATIQEAGGLTAELYLLRCKLLASGKLAGDFQTVARTEGLKTLRKCCGNEPSDSVLELLVDAKLEILDRVLAAEHDGPPNSRTTSVSCLSS